MTKQTFLLSFVFVHTKSSLHACRITHTRNELHMAILEAYNYVAGTVNILTLALVLVKQGGPRNFWNHLAGQTVYFWVARLDNI